MTTEEMRLSEILWSDLCVSDTSRMQFHTFFINFLNRNREQD